MNDIVNDSLNDSFNGSLNDSAGDSNLEPASSAPLTTAIRQLLAEAFEGASAGSTWFVDDQGFLESIRGLEGKRASQPVPPDDTGTSVAAHVEHVRWFLALMNSFARGERPEIRWSDSWSVREVAPHAWETLQADLEREFQELSEHLERGLDAENPERLMPILAKVTHVAYHLGAVRQLIKIV